MQKRKAGVTTAFDLVTARRVGIEKSPAIGTGGPRAGDGTAAETVTEMKAVDSGTTGVVARGVTDIRAIVENAVLTMTVEETPVAVVRALTAVLALTAVPALTADLALTVVRVSREAHTAGMNGMAEDIMINIPAAMVTAGPAKTDNLARRGGIVEIGQSMEEGKIA